MNWYLKVLKQYFDFSGRARRTEYWLFRLYNLFFITVAVIFDNTILRGLIDAPLGIISILYIISILIPNLAVTVRRFHDIGKSGWMVLVELIPLIGYIWLLVMMCTPSSPESNQYGANPIGDNEGFSAKKKRLYSAIFIPTVWSILNFLLVIIAPRIAALFNIDIGSTYFFEVAGIISCSLGLIVPVYLVRLIKNKAKRMALYICSALFMLFILFYTVNSWYSQWFNTIL